MLKDEESRCAGLLSDGLRAQLSALQLSSNNPNDTAGGLVIIE